MVALVLTPWSGPVLTPTITPSVTPPNQVSDTIGAGGITTGEAVIFQFNNEDPHDSVR